MGKSKKKKQKTADFQKVKLKVGKRKPVGTNVTNTSFHTSTIQIGTQFETGNEPVNRKKLSLKELLTQLNHYNINVRHEALGGLRDLFQTHPTVMHEQLSIWIPKLFIKLTDLDASVRHSLILCLNHVFANLIEMEVSPFFKVIMAHVCCGLTHINEGVQLDSLDILGTIIDKYPLSFIPFSNKILENVIDLISNQSSKETTSNHKGSKAMKGIPSLVNRQLSVNADSLISTFKTRTRVLQKLYQIIKVFRQPPKNVGNEKNENFRNNVIHVIDEKQVFIRLFKYSTIPTPLKNVDVETLLEMDERNKIINETGDMETLIFKIFPLILNIWVEYEPNKLSSNLNDSHSFRSLLPGMKVIIDILDILLDPLQKYDEAFQNNVSLLFKSYSKEVLLHFLSSFNLPIHFQKSSSNKSIKTGNPDTLQQFSIDFNFLMAKIICSLLKQSHNGCSLINESKQRITFLKNLFCFICLMIDSNSLLVHGNKITQLLEIVDNLLLVKRTCDKKEAEIIDTHIIFKKVLDVYKIACLSSPWKFPLITYFSKYLSEDRYIRLLEGDEISEHMKGFIESLIVNVWSMPASSESLIKKSLDFIKLILVRNLVDDSVISSIPNSFIEMTNPSGLFKNLKDNLQRCIIEIIYHIDIPDALFKNLALLCHVESISLSVKKYLISVIGYCTRRKEKSLELERYVSFILSVVIGFSMDDLQKFNIDSPNSVSWSILNIIPNEHKQIPVDYAIAQLEQLNGLDHVLSLLLPVIGHFLINLRKLPVTAAAGLVKLLENISSWQEFQYGLNGVHSVYSEINQIADLLSAILLYSVSETYKDLTRINFDSQNDEQLTLEDDLIFSCFNLLLNNKILLRLLIKKWINILGEYKMNDVCVNSIIEVLIVLLQDPKLLPVLSEFKSNFQSIVKAFYPVCMPQIQKSLIEQLNMQVMLL